VVEAFHLEYLLLRYSQQSDLRPPIVLSLFICTGEQNCLWRSYYFWNYLNIAAAMQRKTIQTPAIFIYIFGWREDYKQGRLQLALPQYQHAGSCGQQRRA
jgi:hypothetical protein